MADTADTYTVERSLTIQAPPERVYEQIADFHNWRNWSPWEDVDPQLERTYSGADSGTGAVYEWSGNRKAGRGRMEITEATEPTHVHVDLRFEKPFKAENPTDFRIDPDAGGSRVTWTMTGKKTFMIKAMNTFMKFDNMLGKDFEKGLERLRATTEQQAV
jgi:uncharacterized protein YndB with AHSA1/START domain